MKQAKAEAPGGMRTAAALLAAALCVLLIVFGDAVRAGALEGLRACAEVIIPSLYLFMAVAGFIALSEAGEILARPLAPLTRRFFRLPGCMGSAIVLSFLGGYPVGAKTIATLLERGKIDREQAGRALCFCCNAGPSFVVTAVGAGMLGSARAGGVLLAAHVVSALLIGLLLARRAPFPRETGGNGKSLPFSEAFIGGINGATSGILSICAFVVFFSAFGALLDAAGATSLLGGDAGRAALVGLLEVTSGCIAAAALPGRLPLVLVPLMISFGGLSILFQVRSILTPFGLRFGKFYLCRFLHAGLTLAMAYPLLRGVSPAIGAFGGWDPPVALRTPNTPAATTLLLLACAILLSRATRRQDS